jgi:hypothetical protein
MADVESAKAASHFDVATPTARVVTPPPVAAGMVALRRDSDDDGDGGLWKGKMNPKKGSGRSGRK